MAAKEAVDAVIRAARNHNLLFRDSLPMIASENITSRTVQLLAATDLAHRYAEGTVGNRFYQGCRYIDEIEAKAIELAINVFGAPHANVQPVSGTNANLAAFFALTNAGDTIMSLDVPHGGHISHVKYSAAGVRNLTAVPHPFDDDRMNISADRMVKTIRSVRPRLVLFGASLFLFPHPVKEARDAADEVGAKIVYDGAHVLGLIAGKTFQDPLREGADVLTGSTHKTFPGPQGAIILCREELAEAIDHAVFPGTVSNHHLHHLAGLAVSLAEMQEFGREYASQTISNAKALAQALFERGFNVLCEEKGFTESHQVVVDVRAQGGGAKVAVELEKSGIITNKNLLPWDHVRNSGSPSGLRLGTQELTRLGMKEHEMGEVADLVARVAIKGDSPEKVKKDVINLKACYRRVCYCFDSEDAYWFPEF
ncbi:MAG TPA: serine hydroxymethyltransferase [Candidatus Methanoperedenaceae archaeon]|nr:serine hydroxymethyltransferase [Candidatus Methanoperedenaceae archaeon]